MGWEKILLIVLFIFSAYIILPNLFLLYLGIGSFKSHLGEGVVLSFDDGPDPEYTSQLLDLLDRHGVKAVFFLVGEKAQKHPELVREMLQRGHQIGLHGQIHHHGCLMGPIKTWRSWSEGKANLELLTGLPMEWIRPPWGAFNLVSWLWFRRHGLKAVLWTAQGHDWKKTDPNHIEDRILRRIDEGAIILLHDGGKRPEAHQIMLIALEELIRRIYQEKRLSIVPLKLPRISLARHLAVRLWYTWEGLYARQNKILRVDSENIYRISTMRYQGPELKDGSGNVIVRDGDEVGELHLNNVRMQTGETEPARIAVATLRKAHRSLPGLASYVTETPEFANIEALVSVTLINRGLKGLGFLVEELPATWKNRGIGFMQQMILRIYHPAGNPRRMGQPKLVWITKHELQKRWLPEDQSRKIH